MPEKKQRRFGLWLAILAKGAKLLKLLKMLKFAQVFITLISMGISAVVYSFMFGPWFAVGLVVLLLVHEMGHVIALKMKGLPASAPVFIPMLGAAIFAPKFGTSEDEAFVGYGGPLLGTISAVAMFAMWKISPHPVLLTLCYVAVFINLFNLIPIRPLDGGRITQIQGEWFKYVGIGVLAGMTLLTKEPVMLLVWILVLTDLRLDPRFKIATGSVCQMSMMVMMFMGYGDQPGWVNAIDIVFASMFNLIYVAEAKGLGSQQQQEKAVVTKAPLPVKVKWFALYVGLTAGLLVFMHLLAPYLPKG